MIIAENRPTTIPASAYGEARELWFALSYTLNGERYLVLVDHAVEKGDGFNVYWGEASDVPGEECCIGYLCTDSNSVSKQSRSGLVVAGTEGTLLLSSIFDAAPKAQLMLIGRSGIEPTIELEPFDHTRITISFRRTAPGLIVTRR